MLIFLLGEKFYQMNFYVIFIDGEAVVIDHGIFKWDKDDTPILKEWVCYFWKISKFSH